MNDSEGATRSYTRKYTRRREVIAYGFAGCGENMSYSMVTSYITYFFVNVFNIDPRIVSGMLFVEGLWDTINDPLMGALVDKTRTRWGKLRPYLLGVPIPLAIATAVLFGGPLLLGAVRADGYPQGRLYGHLIFFMGNAFHNRGRTVLGDVGGNISE